MKFDPASSPGLFQHDRVAAGYVSARPFLHPKVFARLGERLSLESRLGRVLDVGCGTGMSSLALLGLAKVVIGIDSSLEMLRRTKKTEHIHYLASSAEELPFSNGSFDLITACGSIDWVVRARFLPRVWELLADGGWLVPLDFGDKGNSREIPSLEIWYNDVFLRTYPRPPSIDPMIGAEEAEHYGFSEPVLDRFAYPFSFSARQYSEFLLTESNVIAAVEYGRQTARQVREWLESQLTPMFGGKNCNIIFGGYIQTLRKL